jgi:hypothetical protein
MEDSNLKLLDRAKSPPLTSKWPIFCQNIVECPVERKFVLFEVPKD